VPEIAVATFNVHCGVDGWGWPYDLEGACRLLDADVLVLQETWTPRKGPGIAHRVGEALGYDVITRPFAQGWLFQPDADDPARSSWGPKPWTRARTIRALKRQARTDRARVPRPTGTSGASGYPASFAAAAHAHRPSGTPRRFQRGTWDLSVLTRIPVAAVEVLDLGKPRIDPIRREAVVLTVHHGGTARRLVTIVGTHMSHLRDGSPLQYRRLARLLPADDVIVAGDMNMPGLPLRAMLPGYRRVVRGRTWPAWRPVIQGDHILATPGLAARAKGEVVPAARGSDHVPVRARFVFN
jgi:endonuclease/exonuclease/phosphatase family metal-dependent hydrolase